MNIFSDIEHDAETQQEQLKQQSSSSIDPQCKPEVLSCEESAMIQLAKEIETVANTLLDEQKSKQCDIDIPNVVPMESESSDLIVQNSDLTNKGASEPIFKPSVTALPYSMLEMSNVKSDTALNVSALQQQENL